MEPLDLTVAPPRDPHAEAGGVVFLPRSIDKVRATLPGGKLGAYNLEGFTEMLFGELGISVEHVTALVGAAKDDAEVAAAILKTAPAGARERWNDFIGKREPRGGNRMQALESYPWLGDRPDLILAIDVLAEDDRRSFRR